MRKVYHIESVAQMEHFAAKCYQQLSAQNIEGLFIHLCGELGAGKTTFVRGFLRGMGYEGVVKSPTYTLVESYEQLIKTVYHFDLYRLNDPLELENIGIRDYFEKGVICLIEWPEKAGTLLPPPDLKIEIAYFSDEQRKLTVTALSDRGRHVVQAINS